MAVPPLFRYRANLLFVAALFVCITAFGVVSGLASWQVLNDANQPDARHENAYVEVNGKFYIMGGRFVRPVQIYDPNEGRWAQGSHPPDFFSLHHFQAAALGDTIYVLAAYTGTYPDEDQVENVYKYDTVTDTWVVGPEIPESRRRGSAGVAVRNGKFYIVCGSTGGHGAQSIRRTWFDEYDPSTNTWTQLPDAPRARDHFHTAIVGNKLYVAGGRDGNIGDNIAEVDVYDFDSGQWSTLPSNTGDIPTTRSGTATVAVGQFVVVIGGESNQTLANDEVEALNTATNSWVTLPPLNIGRHGTQAFLHQDKIYIAAGSGQQGGSPELTSHEVFDTSQEPKLPVELATDIVAIADSNRVYLQWRTLSETNNAGFEIQHRLDGSYITVGFVEGHGTSVVPHDYSFTVSNLAPGRHVFRLKQIDFDGAFEFSPEVSATVELQSEYVLGPIYPNPTNPQARFELTVDRSQEVRIDVYDVMGRHMTHLFSGSLESETPYSFVLDSQSLAGGTYMVRVRGAYFMTSKVFTVLK